MFNVFLPKYVCDSAYNIDYEYLYNIGYRGIIFDIDNTLVLHDKESNDTVRFFIKTLYEIGYKIIILSNNNEDRVKKFSQDSGIKYYIYKSNKPLIRSYNEASKILGIDKKYILNIGDQLFTDIFGGNNAQIDSVLVDPVGPEIYIKIKFKRVLEKIVKIFNKDKFIKNI